MFRFILLFQEREIVCFLILFFFLSCISGHWCFSFLFRFYSWRYTLFASFHDIVYVRVLVLPLFRFTCFTFSFFSFFLTQYLLLLLLRFLFVCLDLFRINYVYLSLCHMRFHLSSFECILNLIECVYVSMLIVFLFVIF